MVTKYELKGHPDENANTVKWESVVKAERSTVSNQQPAVQLTAKLLSLTLILFSFPTVRRFAHIQFSKKQEYASLCCHCHGCQFCHSCSCQWWSWHWKWSWKGNRHFGWRHLSLPPRQGLQKDPGGQERGKMFEFRKTCQHLTKASPYLASRILGYHRGPLLPSIIIPAAHIRGASRKKAYYFHIWLSLPLSKLHLPRSYLTEYNPRNAATRVNYIGKSETLAEFEETENVFPSAPHSGVPLIASGAGGFNLVFPSFNLSPNPTCFGCSGAGRGSGTHGSVWRVEFNHNMADSLHWNCLACLYGWIPNIQTRQLPFTIPCDMWLHVCLSVCLTAAVLSVIFAVIPPGTWICTLSHRRSQRNVIIYWIFTSYKRPLTFGKINECETIKIRHQENRSLVKLFGTASMSTVQLVYKHKC